MILQVYSLMCVSPIRRRQRWVAWKYCYGYGSMRNHREPPPPIAMIELMAPLTATCTWITDPGERGPAGVTTIGRTLFMYQLSAPHIPPGESGSHPELQTLGGRFVYLHKISLWPIEERENRSHSQALKKRSPRSFIISIIPNSL